MYHALIYRKVNCEEQALADDVKANVDFVLKDLPATEGRSTIRNSGKAQQHEVMSNHENRWLEKQYFKGTTKPHVAEASPEFLMVNPR